MSDVEEKKEEEQKVFVNGQEMSNEDFQKLRESDKSKRYVESEDQKGHYRSLSRMRG